MFPFYSMSGALCGHPPSLPNVQLQSESVTGEGFGKACGVGDSVIWSSSLLFLVSVLPSISPVVL